MTAREYRLEPSLRRCCWYGVVAVPLVAVTMMVTALFLPHRDKVRAVVAAGLLPAVGIALVAPLTWRLCVDDRGLSRWLVGIRAFWPWEDFHRGVIKQQRDGSMVHSEWSSWNPRRRLKLPLTKGDKLEVFAAIKEHYCVPELPRAADSLSLRLGLRRYRFDSKGLHMLSGKDLPCYLWSEVEAVDVEYQDVLGHNIRRLEIVLPDRVLDFRVEGGNTSWSGATPEELVAFLAINTSPDIVYYYRGFGPLPRRAWVKRRAEEAQQEARGIKACLFWLSLGLLACYAGLAIKEGFLQAAAMMTPVLIFSGLLWWVLSESLRVAEAWQTLWVTDLWQTTPPPQGKW